MSENINYDDVLDCPFCGKEPNIDTAMFGNHLLARCMNNSCTLSSVIFTFESWQDRAESQLKERAENGWRKIEDGLPEEGQSVLFTLTDDDFNAVFEGFLQDGQWYLSYGAEILKGKVIAWQPLPEPYQK